MDVFLRALEEFGIGLRKHLVQRVGKFEVLQSPLYGCDGRRFIEILDLQDDGVEMYHEVA